MYFERDKKKVLDVKIILESIIFLIKEVTIRYTFLLRILQMAEGYIKDVDHY